MALFLGIGMPGGMELFVIGMILLLLFGGTKLPKLARSLGQSIVEFKKGVKGGGGDDDEDEKQLPSGQTAGSLPKDGEPRG